MTKTISLRSQLVAAVLAILIAAGVWTGRGAVMTAFGPSAGQSGETRRAAAAIRVVTADVVFAADDLGLEAVGTGRALKSVSLRPESEGKVVEMALAAGAHFSKGEALLKLDDTDETIAVGLASARLEEAERDLQRAEQLQGRGFAAVAALDEARTAAKVAAFELQLAAERLADRTLRAPFDGVASFPEIEVGDWIDTDDVVARFDDRSTLLIEFDAPEVLLSRIEIGMVVGVESAAAPGVEIAGEITAIDSRLDATNRSARIRVSARNEEDALRPGASFNVRLNLPGPRYARAPELALQFAREGLHVWRVSDGKAERVPVTLVRRRADGVLVEGGLREGDRIVVEGAQRLAPGRAVEITADPAARSS